MMLNIMYHLMLDFLIVDCFLKKNDYHGSCFILIWDSVDGLMNNNCTSKRLINCGTAFGLALLTSPSDV